MSRPSRSFVFPKSCVLATGMIALWCAACSNDDVPDLDANTGATAGSASGTSTTGGASSTGMSGGVSGTGSNSTSGSTMTTGGSTGGKGTGDTTAGSTGSQTTSSSASTIGGTGASGSTSSGDTGPSSTGGTEGSASDGGKGQDAAAATEGGREGGARDSGTAGEAGANCAGHALSLSGNSAGANDTAKQVMHADLGSDLPAGNAHRTIEFWAYVPASAWVGNVNTMFFYGSTTRPSSSSRYAHGFGLDFGTNAVNGNHTTLDPFTNGGYDNDNQPSGLAANPSDQWVHLAMTWDGTAVRTYVNGMLRITTMSDGSATGLATDMTPIQLGAYEQENAYFNGVFDEFRVWNIDRSASDIASTMHTTLLGNEPGLVAYYRFDEASGTTAADSTISAGHTPHDGTLSSASGQPKPSFLPSTAPIACP